MLENGIFWLETRTPTTEKGCHRDKATTTVTRWPKGQTKMSKTLVLVNSMRLFLGLFFLAMIFSGTTFGDDGWPAADRADIEKAEAFLNEIDTYRARFAQVAWDGGYSEGWLWLERPHYLRIEYAPPNNLLLVADGNLLIFFDRDIDQVSQFQYDTGPFRFLLSKDINFSKDMIVNAIQRRAGFLRIKLVDETNPGQGFVTLIFEEAPMRLVAWDVTDAENKTTQVKLYEHSFGLPLERKLFRFTGHDRLRDNYRYGTYE